MIIAKKFQDMDKKTIQVSKIFNSVIAKTPFPLKFDRLEFGTGHDAVDVRDSSAKLFIDINDPFIREADTRTITLVINFELFRLLVRKITETECPRPVEDVLVGREMVRNGFEDELAYLFYVFVAGQKITGIKSFVKASVPWLVFKPGDKFYCELFYSYAKSCKRRDYERRAAPLLRALEKDLWDTRNLRKCIKLYRGIADAGD